MDDSGAVTRPGQSVFMSVYRTKVAGQCRLITITWCKNMMFHGLSVSFQGLNGGKDSYLCKVEMKPWYFWRRQGSKRFQLDGKIVELFWDLRTAKFSGETEPKSDYYVAVVCEEEVVLILGDMKKDAYKKTKSRPALIEPILVSRKEHIFGKRRFSTRAKFNEKWKSHEISIECATASGKSGNLGVEPEMMIKVDGVVAIHVKHLQWKFRGNECISVNKGRVEIYWDVHDWLFSPGLRHALFIFKPISSSTFPSPISSSSSSSQTANSSFSEGYSGNGDSSEYCLFLYAWKVE